MLVGGNSRLGSNIPGWNEVLRSSVKVIWRFPEMGVPNNGWLIMENTLNQNRLKWMIWGYPYCRKPPCGVLFCVPTPMFKHPLYGKWTLDGANPSCWELLYLHHQSCCWITIMALHKLSWTLNKGEQKQSSWFDLLSCKTCLWCSFPLWRSLWNYEFQ